MRIKILNVIKQYFILLSVLMILGFVTIKSTTLVLERITQNSLKEISNLTSILVEKEIEKLEIILDKLSEFETIKNPLSTIGDKVNVLTQFREENDMSDIAVGDLKGYIYSSSRPEGVYVGDRDYYLGALQGETVLSGPFESRADGQSVFVLSKPVINDAKVVCVVVSIFRLSYLNQLISDVGFMDTGSIAIIDENGIYLSNKDTSLNGKTISLPKNFGSVLDGVDFAKTKFNGKDYYFRIERIDKTPWLLVSSVETQDIMGFTSHLQNILLTLILILGISIIVVNAIFRNLKKRAIKNQILSKNAIETAEIMSLTIDSDLKIMTVNKYFISHMSGSSSDYVGLPILDFMKLEDQDKFKDLLVV